MRRRAIDKALDWCMTRLNGEDGLGAIFPPMANVVMAFDALGYGPDHPPRRTARRALDLLLTEPANGSQYCQPCVSPVWDTGLAALSLMECDGEDDRRAADDSLPWLADLQILDVAGDWAAVRPDAPPGGWAFQYRNDYYPDVDDTAVVAMALHRADPNDAPRGDRAGGLHGSSPCRTRTAAGAPLTPRTSTTRSTTSPSPTTAPCSTRQPPTSARAA